MKNLHPVSKAALCIAVLCATLLGVYLLWQHVRTPHIDGFSGSGESWTPYGGAWELDHGMMRNNSDERGAKLLSGRSGWRDYSIDADVALLGAYGDSGLIVRARDPEEGVDSYRGFFAGLRTLDNTLILGRADFGWEEYKATPIPGNLQPRRFYHMHVVAVGCAIAVRVDLRNGTSVHDGINLDDCVRSGLVGLKSYQTPAIWKNFHVAPATEADVKSVMQGSPLRSARNHMLHPAGENVPVNDMAPIQQDAIGHKLEGESTPVAKLRLLDPTTSTHASIHGIVGLLSPMVYVEDLTGGIAIQSHDAPALAIGDEVEMTGDVSSPDGKLMMRNAHVKILGSRSSFSPAMITADAAAAGMHDGQLAVINGTVLGSWQRSDMQQVLELENDGEVFRAYIERNHYGAKIRKFAPRTALQITGIIRSDTDYAGNSAFAVLVSPVDGSVRLLHDPPFWTPSHVAYFVLILLGIVVGGVIIYHKIKERYLIQMVQERELLAHDLHDTVSQSFAGIGFQLRAIENTLGPATPPELERAQAMVHDSHEELRRSITTLRTEVGSLANLANAMECCARRLVNSDQIRVHVDCDPTPQRLPLKIADCFFRIGQEAISNAVSHADASEIRIRMQYAPPHIVMEVADNGTGLDENAQHSGFGLFGMKKRAEMAGAQLAIASTRNGTSVRLEAKLPRSVSRFRRKSLASL